MDPSLDDFINYDSQFMFKYTDTLDAEFSHSSPFSENSDVNVSFPAFLPKTIQNLLDPEDEPQNHESIFSSLIEKSPQLQYSKEESPNELDFLEASESMESFTPEETKSRKKKTNLNSQSKRIAKKEKGKLRTKAKKTSTEVLLQKADPKHIPKQMEDPNLDDDTRKKMVQMIRNRISAQNSRDRKKFYIQQLEEIKDLLTEENNMLTSDKKTLVEKLKKMEVDQEILKQEISTLKKSLPPVCSSCGFTMDYSSRNQETTEDNSSHGRSTISSPVLERGASRGGRGFFGFSMAFTALLCLFFVLSNDQQKGGLWISSGNERKMNMIAIPRSLVKETGQEFCTISDEETEKEAVQMVSEGSQTTDVPLLIQSKIAEVQEDENHILNKIKPMMDQFKANHEKLFQIFENSKLIVDISNTKLSDPKLQDNSTKPKRKSRDFLGKASITPQNKPANKTSTLFCPTGFEFFASNATDECGNNIQSFGNEAHSNFDAGSKTLDLEKAEYIQLLLPKQSIGRLGIAENSSEINTLPTFYESHEQDSIIEVWCKVFAIRDLTASL